MTPKTQTTNTLAHRMFATLQKVGQSLMIPVSVLPAAGLLVALGRMIQNSVEGSTAEYVPFVLAIGKLCFSGGLAIFEQLPVVFAVGVAIGFTGGAGVAGLAAVAGYFTLVNVLKVMGDVRALPLAINTGVFGGIIIGLLTASLYQRFFQTKLHPVLGFFSGKRLVPIVTTACAIGVGLLLGFVWPPIQAGIADFGHWVMGSEFGPAFYAAGKRLLIPVGLHHVYYPSFLFEFGEFVTSTGQVLKGESARYFGGDPTAGRFMASEFPIMLFGLPAAAFAMYLRAKPEQRKAVGGVMLSAALTSIITGITEPIEFAFIFVAPLLYFVHVATAFFAGFLTGLFDIHLGYTFSASLIDFVLGFFNQKNSLMLFALVGPVVAALYFGVFYWAIGYFDFKTPGRTVGDEADAPASSSPQKTSNKAWDVLVALGGGANILALDACITRLRLTVKDGAMVNESKLRALGAAGVLNAGGGNYQVIFGVESEHLKEDIKSIMVSGQIANASGAGPVKATSEPQLTTMRKNGALSVAAPLNGRLLKVEQVPDPTFAQKFLGDGFAIDPTDGLVTAPVEGTVTQLFRTNHAIGLTTDEGFEVLIHIGLDTVKMNGDGFRALVLSGSRVKVGDPLIQFDLELVRKRAKSTITPVVFTNSESYRKLSLIESLEVHRGRWVAEIELATPTRTLTTETSPGGHELHT